MLRSALTVRAEGPADPRLPPAFSSLPAGGAGGKRTAGRPDQPNGRDDVPSGRRGFTAADGEGFRTDRIASPKQEGRSAHPLSRSRSLDDVDGSPDRGVYIQMRGIEQVRIGRPDQRGGGAAAVALVAAQDVGQDRGRSTACPCAGELRGAPARALLGRPR